MIFLKLPKQFIHNIFNSCLRPCVELNHLVGGGWEYKRYETFTAWCKHSSCFLFCCKKLYCLHLVQGLGDSSRVVKKLPSGCREGLQADALTPEGLLKTAGLRTLLVVLEGEPFEERLAQPRLGTSRPVEVGQVVATFWMSFTCSSRKQLSRKSQRRGSARAEPRACGSKRAWFRFFPMRMAASIASWVLFHSFWDGFCASWKRARLEGWFCIFKRCWALSCFSLANLLPTWVLRLFNQ